MESRAWRIRLLAILGLVLVLGLPVLGVWLGWIQDPWVTFRIDRLFARNFGTVEPGLYRGGQPSAAGREWLWSRYHFGTVVHLAWRDTPRDREEAEFFKAAGADYHAVAWQPEGPPSNEELERVLKLVKDGKKPVFVHCVGGKDRTGGVIGMLALEKGATLAQLADDWRRYGTPARGWQVLLQSGPRPPLDPKEEVVARVTAVHGGAGPFVVAGYRMGAAALARLGLERGDFDLEVTHYSPKAVQYTCIADGAAAATLASPGRLNLNLVEAEVFDLRTVYKRRSTGAQVVLRLQPQFVATYLDTPRLELLDAGQRVLRLKDEEIFTIE